MRMLAIQVLIAFVGQPVPSVAQHELVDPKTGEYTPRGVVASMIAGAQVTEMRCGMKGQITASAADRGFARVPFATEAALHRK